MLNEEFRPEAKIKMSKKKGRREKIIKNFDLKKRIKKGEKEND